MEAKLITKQKINKDNEHTGKVTNTNEVS